MTLVERLNQAIGQAMKAHDAPRLGALRLLKTALVNRGVEKGRDLEPAEEQQVIGTLIKQRREAAEQFEHAGRHEMAAKEKAEVPILEEYQVAKADPSAIEAAVDRAISETAATSAKDIGKVMKAAMAILAGQTVDGRAVNELVRQKLTR
ncbi:MAG: GatB/YqeY domain-containing protein [Bacteroidales bacterium]